MVGSFDFSSFHLAHAGMSCFDCKLLQCMHAHSTYVLAIDSLVGIGCARRQIEPNKGRNFYFSALAHAIVEDCGLKFVIVHCLRFTTGAWCELDMFMPGSPQARAAPAEKPQLRLEIVHPRRWKGSEWRGMTISRQVHE